MFLNHFSTFFIHSAVLWSNFLLQSKYSEVQTRPNDKGGEWNSGNFKFIGSMKINGGGGRGRITPDDNDYYVSVNPATWTNAAGDCKFAFGPHSHLLTIESEEERDHVNFMLDSYGIGQYWTSGIFDSRAEIWRWGANNKPLPDWAPWAIGNPSTPGHPYHRVLLEKTKFTSQWKTIYDTQIHRYICEVPIEQIAVPCKAATDLVIVLDSSNSIGDSNFERAKYFAAKLAEAFSPDDETQLGFITYSTFAQSIFELYHPLPPHIITDFILSAKYLGGESATDEAIDEAVAQFYRLLHPRPSKSIVVLTDGRSNNPLRTIDSANNAISKGIQMFTVGITSDVNTKGLLDITGGNATRVFTDDQSDQFIHLLKPLSLMLCPV